MLFKLKWTHGLLFYSLCISIVLLLGFVCYFFVIDEVFADSAYGMSLSINSESNIITVTPDWSTRVISESDIVNYKFEFKLSEGKIQEILNIFSPEIINNEITGQHADYIITEYIMPIIWSTEGEMYSLFRELLSRF
jgi:hypothetical protein